MCKTGTEHSPSSFSFSFFFFLTVPLMAYGSSQARGRIGAEAEAYATAKAIPDLSHVFELCCSFGSVRSLSHGASQRLNPHPHGHYAGFLID